MKLAISVHGKDNHNNRAFPEKFVDKIYGPITYEPWPIKWHTTIKEALSIAHLGTFHNTDCTSIFNEIIPKVRAETVAIYKKQGGRPYAPAAFVKKSLAELLNEPLIWISFSPATEGGLRGDTYHPYDLTICFNVVKKGPKAVARAIVHELTHLAGVPGSNNERLHKWSSHAEKYCVR